MWFLKHCSYPPTLHALSGFPIYKKWYLKAPRKNGFTTIFEGLKDGDVNDDELDLKQRKDG